MQVKILVELCNDFFFNFYYFDNIILTPLFSNFKMAVLDLDCFASYDMQYNMFRTILNLIIFYE